MRCGMILIMAAWAIAGPATADTPATPTGAVLPYTIVDTGQTKCYDNRHEIAPPKPGLPFYGQDAQFPHHPSSYTLPDNGLTVYDNNTGLTWQRTADTNGDGQLGSADKLTWTQAQAQPAKLNAAKFAGFSDWRLPTIKELYSLIQFSGVDVSGPNAADTSRLTPFIDTKFFKFAYGDARAGERTIDSQWATSTGYVGHRDQMFGVNFADGRIKGYGTIMPGRGEKTFYVLCVRGNTSYGKNDFHDNNDGTITDRATGLMWSKADSGKGMNWQEALAWAQKKNAEKYLGHADWRVPNIKELQSILDYTRSPDKTKSAAIDPLFNCTAITNEAGQADFPYYWSSTTHAGFTGGGAAGYMAFGRASGWMSPRPAGSGFPDPRPPSGPMGPGPSGPGMDGPPEEGPPNPGRTSSTRQAGSSDYHFVDVHGAGAQRSDPKTGDAADFPHGRGPQGDVIRILNYVRLVRNVSP